jgi:PPP family 3-phenylpropionic acid transporter
MISRKDAGFLRFLALYGAIYGSYGVVSPFLPAFLESRGVAVGEIGIVVGAGTALRLLASPAAGRLGDRLHSIRTVLASCIALGAVAAPGYLLADGLAGFLVVAATLAFTLGPMSALADALALESARPRAPQGFEYGHVRGAGSAAFIVGTLVSGQVVARTGLSSIVWMQAALLACATFAALRLPEPGARKSVDVPDFGFAVLRIAAFRRVVLAAALVLGSHAMHDAFAVIRWREAGVGAPAISLLWSEAVAAEVVMFFFIGPRLAAWLSPAGAIALAAAAGIVRWSVMASTATPSVIALVQPLHGLTFALFHLAAMRLIARSVPEGGEGTAQALYTIGGGAASALLAFASGGLYARLGAGAFWAMALLCLLALPVAAALRKA